MKLQNKFTFTTPFNTYGYANGKAGRNELVCYIRVSGVGYYGIKAHQQKVAWDVKNGAHVYDCSVEDYLTFDISEIITQDAKGNEVTLSMDLWNMKDIFSDGLRDTVEKSTQAHLLYVFEDDINPKQDNTPDTFEEARNDYERDATDAIR